MVPPGWMFPGPAIDHVKAACSVSDKEAARLLRVAEAEGRVRVDYSFANNQHPNPHLRNVSRAFRRRYYAPDVWREFPPVSASAPQPNDAVIALGETKAKTKLSLPIAELAAEMRRRANGDRLEPRWMREAKKLNEFAASDPVLSDRPHSVSAIRNNTTLQTEYKTLVAEYERLRRQGR